MISSSLEVFMVDACWIYPAAIQSVSLAILIVLILKLHKQKPMCHESIHAKYSQNEMEKRYQHMLDAMVDFAWEIDAQGRIVYISDKVYEILEYTPSEIIGKTPYDIVLNAQEAEKMQAVIGHAVERKEPFRNLEHWARTKHGGLRCLLASGVPIIASDGSVVGFRGVNSDISSKKRVEAALSEREAMYRSVVENIKEVVFQTDAAGYWMFLNPSWTELTGYDVDETLGTLFLDYVHPDDREKNTALFAPLVNGEKDYCRHEIRYVRNNGDVIWVEVFARLTIDEKGQVVGTSGTLSDINLRKEMEEEKEKARRKELEIGSKIQQSLLLASPAPDLPMQVSAFTVPSQHVDGDFYDFINFRNGCFDVIIADVMGKGVPAALVGAGTKNLFSRVTGKLAILGGGIKLPEPEAIVNEVHRRITPNLRNLEKFITAFYCRFDTDQKRITFVDCGHTSMIIYRAEDRTATIQSGDNIPLGIMADVDYHQTSMPVADNDVIVFYSDGVPDAQNERGEMFGEERLLQAVEGSGEHDSNEIIAQIKNSVQSFCGGLANSDDLSCVVVKMTKVNEGRARNTVEIEMPADDQSLQQLRCAVRRACSGASWVLNIEMFEYELVLVVHEIVCRIIYDVYKGEEDKRILLRGEAFDDKVVIEVGYTGEWVLEKGEESEIDSLNLWDIDIRIIRSLSDVIDTYEDESGMKFIRIEKHKEKGEHELAA